MCPALRISEKSLILERIKPGLDNLGIKQEINIDEVRGSPVVLRQGLSDYQEQEESYSSQASFYDRDEIPVYNADNPVKHNFSGKRIKHGSYRTKDNHLCNSDTKCKPMYYTKSCC